METENESSYEFKIQIINGLIQSQDVMSIMTDPQHIIIVNIYKFI